MVKAYVVTLGAKMKTIAIALVTLVVGLVVGVVGIPRMSKASQPTLVPINPTVGPTPTSVVVRTGPTVIKALQNQAKLETVDIKVVKDITIKREQGKFNRCGQELTYLGYYNVTAGIDLSKLSQTNVKVTNDGQIDNAIVTVTLPKAEIMHAALDTMNSRIVTQSDPLKLTSAGCDNLIGNMTQEAQQKISDSVQQDAIEQGILEQADEQAKFAVEKLLLEVGYKNVTVQMEK